VTLKIKARNSALRREGEIDDFLRFTMLLRFNRTSSWTLEVDAQSPAAALLDITGGIIVERDGFVLLSGPVLSRRSINAGGRRTITYAGVDDTAALEVRLALPVPAGPPYTAVEYDDKSGPAETVLRHYVDRNLGPGATVERRLPYLTFPADLGRGTSVRGRGRFHMLLELLQPLALAGGDLGFRIVQVDNALEFQVYVPADRTRTAVFSEEFGNLAGHDYSQTRPVANYVYVGGQGEGTARAVVEGGDAASITTFGRREQFRDRRDLDTTATLEQARTEALAETQAETALSISPIDTAAVSYGRDYRLGDRVTVVIEGEAVKDVVREVVLTLSLDRGEELTPVVGTPGARAPRDLALFAKQERQDRRLSKIERR
jgi:hypothetical protein